MKYQKLIKYFAAVGICASAFSNINEAIPADGVNHSRAKALQVDMVCLAQVIHDEARGEPFNGKVAVGNVVLNRVKTWKRSVCGIVYHKRGKICQFSGMCKANKPYTIESLELAYGMLQGQFKDNTKGATYFHATYVNPNWKSIYKRTVQIGKHIYYESKQTL